MAAAPGAHHDPSPQEARQPAAEAARELLRKGEFEAARAAHEALLGGARTPDDRAAVLSNVAACLLGAAEQEREDGDRRAELLLRCAQRATEALADAPRLPRARWRRARANRLLGHTLVALADLRVLRTLQPADGAVAAEWEDCAAAAAAEAAAATGGGDAGEADRAEDGAAGLRLHLALCAGEAAALRKLCEGGELSRGRALRSFFASGGALSICYMAGAPCAAPAIDALRVAALAAASAPESWLSDCPDASAVAVTALGHPCGREVCAAACAVAGGMLAALHDACRAEGERATAPARERLLRMERAAVLTEEEREAAETVLAGECPAADPLGEGSGVPRALAALPRMQPLLLQLVRTGHAVAAACTAYSLLAEPLWRAVGGGGTRARRGLPFATRLAEGLGVACCGLWADPGETSPDEVGASLSSTLWRSGLWMLQGLEVFPAMRSRLLALTRWRDGAVSGDAATLIGLIDEVLHPEEGPPRERVRGRRVLGELAERRRCAGCSAPEPAGAAAQFQLCGACRLVAYCSIQCQEQDWEAHRCICAHAVSPSRTRG